MRGHRARQEWRSRFIDEEIEVQPGPSDAVDHGKAKIRTHGSQAAQSLGTVCQAPTRTNTSTRESGQPTTCPGPQQSEGKEVGPEHFIKLDGFDLKNGLLFLFPFHFKGVMVSFYGYTRSQLWFLNTLLSRPKWEPLALVLPVFSRFCDFLAGGILESEDPQATSAAS